MPAPMSPTGLANTRAALECCWFLGRRLAEVQRQLSGTLPTSPERLHGLNAAEEQHIEAFLYRLGSAFTTFIEEAVPIVLMAEEDVWVPIRLTHDLRDLEYCAAIPAADEVLEMNERVGEHYLIATLAPEPRTEALNAAWADGEALIGILVWLSQHLQERDLVPGLPPFEPGPP